MKTLLFKKAVSRSYHETKELCTSLNQMMVYVPLILDGQKCWDHGCEASVNKNFEGGWDLVVMSDKIPAARKGRKVHIRVKKAKDDESRPYNNLRMEVNTGLRNTNVLRIK